MSRKKLWDFDAVPEWAKKLLKIKKVLQNKCSVGPETSIPEIEKLKAQLPFLRVLATTQTSDVKPGLGTKDLILGMT